MSSPPKYIDKRLGLLREKIPKQTDIELACFSLFQFPQWDLKTGKGDACHATYADIALNEHMYYEHVFNLISWIFLSIWKG